MNGDTFSTDDLNKDGIRFLLFDSPAPTDMVYIGGTGVSTTNYWFSSKTNNVYVMVMKQGKDIFISNSDNFAHIVSEEAIYGLFVSIESTTLYFDGYIYNAAK